MSRWSERGDVSSFEVDGYEDAPGGSVACYQGWQAPDVFEEGGLVQASVGDYCTLEVRDVQLIAPAAFKEKVYKALRKGGAERPEANDAWWGETTAATEALVKLFWKTVLRNGIHCEVLDAFVRAGWEQGRRDLGREIREKLGAK